MLLSPPLARIVAALVAYVAMRRRPCLVSSSLAQDSCVLGAVQLDVDEVRAVHELHAALAPELGSSGADFWGVQLTANQVGGLTLPQFTLLRSFLVARDWSVADAASMVACSIRGRQEANVIASSDNAALPSEPLGTDSSGRVVTICSFGALPADAFCDPKGFVAWRLGLLERLMRELPFASGDPTYTMVLDCRGMRPHHFSRPARECFRALQKVCCDCYPDLIARIVVLHPPPFFASACALLRPLLPTNFAQVVRFGEDVGEISFGNGASAGVERVATSLQRATAAPHHTAPLLALLRSCLSRLMLSLRSVTSHYARLRSKPPLAANNRPLHAASPESFAALFGSLVGWLAGKVSAALLQAREAFVASHPSEFRAFGSPLALA